VDKLLTVEAFTSLLEARGTGGGLADRVQHRPASQRPGYLTPTDYAKAWATIHPEQS
jgi:hypothetical protein